MQFLDKILVPVVCNDRPSCSRQFRNPWRSHRCRWFDALRLRARTEFLCTEGSYPCSLSTMVL